MTSVFVYNCILLGLYVGILLIFVIVVIIIGLQSAFFSFLDTIFGIHKVSRNDKDIILDVYGSRINFSTSKRLRITLRILVHVCAYIISLVFVDGCILSRKRLVSSNVCPPTATTDCFYFTSAFNRHSKPFYCPPNELISVTNSTSEILLCYTWEIKSQSTVSILSELGICSSILSLIGLLYKCLYHVASYKCWGTILTIGIGLTMIIIPIILWTIFHITISFVFILLLSAAIVLLLNALFLARTVQISNNQRTMQTLITLDRKYSIS